MILFSSHYFEGNFVCNFKSQDFNLNSYSTDNKQYIFTSYFFDFSCFYETY